jgi:hypothetical protein
MGQPKTKLVKQFDADSDGYLGAAERKAAREYLQKERAAGRLRTGPGGPGGFGPGSFLATRVVTDADKDGDRKVTQDELAALGDVWFAKLDPMKTGKVSAEELSERLPEILPAPPAGGPGPQGGAPGGPPGGFGGGGRRGFNPGRFLGPGLFTALDGDKDGSLTHDELRGTLTKWFAEWDKDHRGFLEEDQVRAGLDGALPRPSFGGGPFGRRGRSQEPPSPGPKVSTSDAKTYPDAGLYDAETYRTFFLEFEDADWEKELAEFKNTDVEVPAKLTLDGKVFQDVGVSFRGMSSFMMVGEGRKRSLNLTLDFIHKNQHAGGYRSINLLNAHEDPTFLRGILYTQVARDYIPAPRANLARVVINGESWGVYENVQQFDKSFLKDAYGTTSGARWKVPGSPGGRGSLAYLGDDPASYQRIYDLKTKDSPDVWADLIRLCKTIQETPAERLEEALSPLLDVQGAIKFLAVENALINNDGYWIRTSDYNLYRDEKGVFHIVPHDINETFGEAERPGGFGFRRRTGSLAFLEAGAVLGQADKNGDKKVSRDEFVGLADTWFEKLDTAKAGKVTADELADRFASVAGTPANAGPAAEAPRPDAGPPGGGRAGRDASQALLAAADTDKDSALTLQEIREAFGRWFDAWDAEKSGALDEGALGKGLAQAFPRPAGPPDENFFGGFGPGGPGGPGVKDVVVPFGAGGGDIPPPPPFEGLAPEGERRRGGWTRPWRRNRPWARKRRGAGSSRRCERREQAAHLEAPRGARVARALLAHDPGHRREVARLEPSGTHRRELPPDHRGGREVGHAQARHFR